MSTLFTPSLYNSESHILFDIEDLVIAIAEHPVSDWEKPVVSMRQITVMKTLMDELPRFCSVYHMGMTYAEYTQAFWIACLKEDLIDIHGLTGRILTFDVTKCLCIHIAHQVNSADFKHQQSTRLAQVVDNQLELQSYVIDTLEIYSKTLVVRLDLGIEQQYQNRVGIVAFRELWRRFCRKMEYGSVFRDKIGVLWDIEMGRKKGYHVHLALFYAGREHQNGWFIADACIQIWRELLDGMGCGFNCHTREYLDRYRQRGELGIEMIHRNDEVEKQNCVRTLTYLCDLKKPDQYLRMKQKGMRVFGKGIQ